jgi:hypothetical protein
MKVQLKKQKQGVTGTDCANCGHPREDHNEQGNCMERDGRYGGFCICSLFVSEADATPEMRARRLFGRMFHCTLTRREPFVPGGPCMRDGCELPAARRIMVNIWGSAVEYDVCEACGEEWHGKLVDEFPARRGKI